MKRTRKKHNAVIKAKGWWWRRSGGPDGAASVFVGGGGARACWERGVSKSVVLLTGDRGFESISLQRRVYCEPEAGLVWDKQLRPSRGATPINPGVQFLMAHRVRFRTSVDSRGPAVLQEHGKHAGEGDRLAPDKR